MDFNVSFVGTGLWHLLQLLVLIYFSLKGNRSNLY